ncbi:DUF6073 family protein [Paracoccus aminophilus]|uniref:DUF2993 domain-containing protein n=1 Tax=Paracoccus aminophilus JCM 7686 TaxID=1367847 RepID=S5Z133_PARAH|nr:DUF6073 family protein [Paracoccus aminophilus]AGT11136.1 hypothetical protein JCM7686_pAMI5p070 [Paracoccus aminophilus JCM 7686]
MQLIKRMILGSGAVLALSLSVSAGDLSTPIAPENQAKIDSLLERMKTMDVNAMPSLSVQRFTLPSAGVDVLRAKVEETYTIDGIGRDTVELSGWIAVVHSDPVSIEPGQAPRWGNAQVGTEFVGLSLKGESALFGPIEVSLNPDMPAIGRVGAWPDGKVPPAFLTMVGVDQSDIDEMGRPTCKPPKGNSPPENAPCTCLAPLAVSVRMPSLKLEMKTDRPVVMQSSVETIPPVGYVASTSVEPRALMSDGRKVGELRSAQVKFREIILHEPLSGAGFDQRFDLKTVSND